MNYNNEFFKNYVSTHVLPRKGKTTLDEFKKRAIAYQKQYGRFLPEYKNSKIIDVGCGNGSIIWWLQQNGFVNTWGIDISAEQIETGRTLGVKNIEQADLTEFLNEKKNFYNLVIARDIIEHLDKENIVECLSSCYESLTKDGKIIIQAPNAESPFFGRIRYGDFTHYAAFTFSSLSQLLRLVGFTEVQCYPTAPRIHGTTLFIRSILWKVVEALYKFLLFVEIGRGKKIVSQNIIAVAKKKVKAKATP